MENIPITEKLTLILGASPNPERVAYQAVKNLRKRGVPLIALGRKEYEDEELKIVQKIPDHIRQVHTITLYINQLNQKAHYDLILSLNPKRIIFNPGTKNPELAKLARKQRIRVYEECMLVMLATGRF